MSLNYSYKHDISYANYNNSNLPWKINSSYIYHNNQTINSSLNLGPINNNLVIESSQNNIVLVTPQNNKQVIVNNNMTINNGLDISNILKTNFINANDLCLNGILHTTGLTIKGSINMLGKFKYRRGAIDISVGDTSASETRFRGVNFKNSMFYDSSINNSTILTSDFSNMNIFNSYIYNNPIGYDKSNNSNPAKAVFSDVLLYSLLLDTSTNTKCYIKFSNSNSNSNYNSNYNTPIIIKSSDDYAKLEISKPLNIGLSFEETVTNISNISVFNGDISCNTLYYSQLFPDVKLNNYFDISIGQVSVSGNSIPSINNRFNIGSYSLKFNEITSANFFGFLDGSCTIANDLIKNLDMSFNNLDISGTITLNKQNLAQFLSGDLKTIASSITDFSNANKSLLDLSISLYSKSDFDLCLNTNITKRSLLESSFSRLTNDVTNISNSVYIKSDFDLCLNRNLLRTNDLSAIVSVVTDPLRIYSRLSYLNSSLVKVNSAKVSDELVFPYAITYIDDNVEDTNIRERYSYTMTTNKATTTVTSVYTITYTRVWTSTPIDTTFDIKPDNASHLYVMMQAIRQTGVPWRRKWYDVNSNTTAQAVYRKITQAHTKTDQGPVITKYEVDTSTRTWQQHRDENTSTRTLAVISSSDEKGKVIDAINAYNSNVSYFIGATIINSYSTGGTIIADDNYIYHIFTSNGTFSPNFSGPIAALLVGGGGSGARPPSFSGAGGGGGGGGVIQIQERDVSPGEYDIVIGNGGRGTLNESGSNTTAFGATAAGGGRGRPDVGNGIEGGCGGGVSSANILLSGGSKGGNLTGGSDNIYNIATSHGGNGGNLTNITTDPIRGSGGGGAGGNAPNITTQGVSDTGETGSGAGGIGLASDILGTTYYWGGGGGGAASSTSNLLPTGGHGGKGGGGGGVGDGGQIAGGVFIGEGLGGTNSYISNGGKGGYNYYGSGGNGAPNTGGGGGGCRQGGTPGNGGSGIVIIRYQSTLAQRRANWKWYDNTAWNTSITDWTTGRPQVGTRAAIFSNGQLYDYSATDGKLAIFKNTNYRETTETDVPADDELYADNTFLTWEQHRTNAINLSNQNSNITYKLVSIHSSPENTTIANFAEQSGFDNIFIGGKRKSGSIANGRSTNDWAWDDASNWDHEEFFRGYTETTYNATFTGGDTPDGSSTTTNIPERANTNTPPAAFHTLTDISQTNVKLPLLVSSSNGSIIATATAIKVLDRPANPSNTTFDNRNVSGFTDIAGGDNTQTIRYFTNYASTGNTNPVNVTDYQIQERTLKYEYDTFSYVNSYNANNGLTTGSFKISDNSNNNSNYISPFSVNSIPTSYSCIAVTNDGMFVALGKESDVTVYIRDISGWIILGSPITIDFSAYTNTDVGIIPTQFTDINWRKNLQNLAINFNYATGSATSQLILAFGDTRNVIKVYSYSGVNWSLSNGFYSVTGGSWGSNPLTSYSASVLSVSTNTNFGYFVILSQSPSVLGFSVDDKFYTYNCTTTNNTIRGSRQTLQASYNNYNNIIAFKMTSDAEKIIVSNTHYVFIYKWTTIDWTPIKTIDYVSSAITFTYPNTSTTRISAGPRSLDISNISSTNNDCVFAIGFPDVLIDISVNRKARGYVEYWKLTDSSLNRLATLMPRKRDFNNSSVDSDEYFFSGGGIKITNANTIIVAPNFKFHFNSPTKKYELDPRNDSWTTHNSRATSSRFLASIQNEVENELVKISARNNNVWIGGKRLTNPTNSEGAGGKTSRNWEWITPDPWNYQNFASGQPNALSDTGLEFSGNGWNDLGMSNNRQAIFFNTTTNYSSKNTFTIFNNFFFHSSGFSSSYFPTDISTTVMARWYSTDTSLNPTNTNTIHFTAGGRIVSLTRKILTLSDIRLKENIVDSTPKLEDLLKVRVVNYSLKGSNGAKLIGVVAQELEELFPTLVNDGILSIQDINLGKTESYKSVKYSCFDVILIKAFQEQMAIINKLSLQLDELVCKTNSLKTICQDYVVLTQDLDLLKSENELFQITINEITKLIS
jgi:hypothetical protein